MKKIVVDAFGADKGVGVIVKGAVDSLARRNDTVVVLVGDEEEINRELSGLKYDKSRIEVVGTTEFITNDESPTEAIRAKTDSSLVRALEITKNDSLVAGMVSAGSTGAVLTGAIFIVGRIRGVRRPALCPLLPTQNGGKVCLIDCGANMDCSSDWLVQFALMANDYMKAVCGVEKPRVGLVSVGVEDKKGNALTHETFAKLKELPINFVGNMEARDALSGDYDVLVCDGFVGNVLLKSVEGTAKMVMSVLKREIMGSFAAKLGAVMMKKSFKNMKAAMNYHAFGGAAFLGVQKIIVKSHGSSNAESIAASIEQVAKLDDLKLIDNIKTAIEGSLACAANKKMEENA